MGASACSPKKRKKKGAEMESGGGLICDDSDFGGAHLNSLDKRRPEDSFANITPKESEDATNKRTPRTLRKLERGEIMSYDLIPYTVVDYTEEGGGCRTYKLRDESWSFIYISETDPKLIPMKDLDELQKKQMFEKWDIPISIKRFGKVREPFNIIVVGEVGEGKSSLTSALTMLAFRENIRIERKGEGVTKEIEKYKIRPHILPLSFIYDSPGVGDKDVPMPKLLEKMTKLCGSSVIHCVILCVDMNKGRLNLGSQFVGQIIRSGFIQSYSQVIICGTKADQLDDEYSINEWYQNIGEVAAKKFFDDPNKEKIGGLCHISLNMVRKEWNKKQFECRKANIDKLVALMEEIYKKEDRAMYQHEVNSKVMAQYSKTLFGLEVSNEKERELEQIVDKLKDKNELEWKKDEQRINSSKHAIDEVMFEIEHMLKGIAQDKLQTKDRRDSFNFMAAANYLGEKIAQGFSWTY